MRTRIFILFLLMYILPVHALYSQKLTRAQYIEKYKDIAMRQMHRHKIPASIILAQGCLESNNGNSPLAKKANNHFGIKCHDGWKGKKFKQDDDKRNDIFSLPDPATTPCLISQLQTTKGGHTALRLPGMLPIPNMPNSL